MAEEKLEGFIAFTEKRTEEVEQEGFIDPNKFGRPFSWIPFARTAEDALRKLAHARPKDFGDAEEF